MEELLFVIPARLTRPFFSRLYAECEAKIFERFDEDCRPIVRAIHDPKLQFNAGQVSAILEREFRLSHDNIKLLIVVPTESRQLRSRAEIT